jgi:hypothetical protein
MRTQGFHTRLLLAVAGALGIVLMLSRPWYARAPKVDPNASHDIGDVNGPLYGLLHGMQRWVTASGGETGWHALNQWGVALAALAGISLLGALLCLVPALQSLGRDLLRWGALAAFGLTVVRLLNPPGSNSEYELRNGALLAAGFALMLVICAQGVAAAPLRRRTQRQTYQAPPPPASGYVADTSSSQAPPGV